MSRLVPFRPKASAETAARIEQTLSSTMYLVQTTGPTSYVIQEQNCAKKHKVLIGALQTCSCGTADLCVHILFVMLKVLRVQATTPVVWQKSLIDSEVEMLLQGGYRVTTRPMPKPYVKKRKEEAAAPPEEADVDRHNLVEGEVCAICQEDMEGDQPLTFCRTGCGNNFHIECMKVFGESRRQSKENIICPLCRQDWGDMGLSTLRKEMDAANRALNVHKGTSCRKCKTKPIRCERYRCVQCKNMDLCARCFKSNVHSKHTFVVKQNVTDSWIPALRENQPQASISSDVIRDLENRELSTNDYDMLLRLDHRDKHPIQDYLVKVVSGTKVSAENAKTFGDPGDTCSMCAQSLRIKSSLHSTACGHVFHESCLARSILSQSYVCPYPGCEHALLPGLWYLQHTPKVKTERPKQLEKKLTNALPALCSTLSVFGLRSQQLEYQSTGKLSPMAPRIMKRAIRQESGRFPVVPDLVSAGIKAMGRSNTDLPLSQVGSAVRNQLEHDRVRISSSRHSTPRQPGKRAKPTHTKSVLLPPLNQRYAPPDQTMTESRLSHAEKTRAELMAAEKERLQRQGQLREERRERHKQSYDNPAFYGGFIGTDRSETTQSTIPHSAREEQCRVIHRKLKMQQQRVRQNPLPTNFPDLYIGNKM